jgi:hypothetical protein
MAWLPRAWYLAQRLVAVEPDPIVDDLPDVRCRYTILLCKGRLRHALISVPGTDLTRDEQGQLPHRDVWVWRGTCRHVLVRDLTGTEVEVLGVYTVVGVTVVLHLRTWWNRTTFLLPHPPVREDSFSVHTKYAIATLRRCSPQPTGRGLVDL